MLVFSKAMTDDDLVLANMASRAGWRIIYDQNDNPLGLESPGEIREIGSLKSSVASAVDLMTFPTRATRDEFVANGFPAEKCRILPDPVLSRKDELTAIEWAERHVQQYRHYSFLPSKTGWKDSASRRNQSPMPDKSGERLVWFSSSGRRGHGKAGLKPVADLLPLLNRMSKDRRIELVLVTNDRAGCDDAMGKAKFVWHRLAWNFENCIRCLETADTCIMPFLADDMGQEWLATRLLRPLVNGLPVVTNCTPVVRGLEKTLHVAKSVEQWQSAILTALDQKKSGASAACGDELAEAFGEHAVACDWIQVLQCAGRASAWAHR